MRRILIVFAKEPDAATVKTRLATSLAPDARVAFYTAMLCDVADVARASVCDERILCWSAMTQPHRLKAIFGGFTFVRQSEGSLGDRVATAFAQASERCDVIVLMSSDAPLLAPHDLDAAFRALLTSDLALSPSFDGGFCAVGVRRSFVPRLNALFLGVEWSSKTVFETVLMNYRAIRRDEDAFSLLPMSFDVDTPDDFRLLRAQISARKTAGQPVPPHLDAFFAAFAQSD